MDPTDLGNEELTLHGPLSGRSSLRDTVAAGSEEPTFRSEDAAEDLDP